MIARRKTDPLWPRPVWGDQNATPYTPLEKDSLMKELQLVL